MEEGRSVHDAIPKWPDTWELPHDWRLAFRKLGGSGSLHKVFIPPAQNTGFLYHRSEAEEWMAGTRTTAFPFAASVRIKGKTDEENEQIKKKRKTDDDAGSHFFQLALSPSQDFEARMPAWALPVSLQSVQEAFGSYRKLLVDRGFKKKVELVAIRGQAADNCFARRIGGVYFRKGELFSRSCYQRLLFVSDERASGVCCDRVYIIWSPTSSRWQVTTSCEEGAPVYAYCQGASDGSSLMSVPGPWTLCSTANGKKWQDDPGMRVIADTNCD